MQLSVRDFFNDEYNMSSADLQNLYKQLRIDRKNVISEYYYKQDAVYADPTSISTVAKELNILDIELVFEAAVKEISRRKETYFAFGSNVDLDRIRKRCPSAQSLTTGKLEDYKLVFNMMGNKEEGKGGGIANIEESIGDYVLGALYRIDKQELQELNVLEQSMNYSVETMDIIVTEDYSIDATVYISHEKSSERYAPTKSYRNFIIKGMESNKFPDDYQSEVKRMMSA